MDGKPKMKFRCVEVIAPVTSCNAARSLQSQRLLSAEAPRLPLATCDRPSDYKCIYRHYNDRRQGPRRDNEHATLPRAHTGTERRRRLDRRDSDYA